MYCRKGRDGFTLVELMVVIVILGLLASAVTINVRSYLLKGKQNVARMEISRICQALDTFYAEFDRYPSNEEGIAALAEKSEAFPDGLLSKIPQDPWGNRYQFNQPGIENPYDVICLGADGREGGTGADSDLSSSDVASE